MTLAAIVLAGGRSKRFRSSVPKVLHAMGGRPLLVHVLETLRGVHRRSRLESVVVVVPPGGAVEGALEGVRTPFALRWAVQQVPRGTGDATRIGLDVLGEVDEAVVLSGDVPLLRDSTVRDLVSVRRRSRADASVLTAVLDEPGDLGRVVRAGESVSGIVEVNDASAEQLALREVNVGTYVFDASALRWALPRLEPANAQGELYLTDVVRVLVDGGRRVVAFSGHPDESLGANTRKQFAEASAVMRRRIIDALMDSGVTIVDPATTYVDADVRIGADTIVRPGSILERSTRVGAGCEVGPDAWLVDARVGDGARISYSVVWGARVRPRDTVGPFAVVGTPYTDDRGVADDTKGQ